MNNIEECLLEVDELKRVLGEFKTLIVKDSTNDFINSLIFELRLSNKILRDDLKTSELEALHNISIP